MIAFIGSVFSPYYHWSGRKAPENHVALNVALYGPAGAVWAMTERGRGSLTRSQDSLRIGRSHLAYGRGGLAIRFDEMALPWPGQRLLPKRVTGEIFIHQPSCECEVFRNLDPLGHHLWWPVFPRAKALIISDDVPGGGWQGEAYHDFNAGERPLEADFIGWDWARGPLSGDAGAVLYDAKLADGSRRSFGLSFSPDGAAREFPLPARQTLRPGFWGVEGGISCDAGLSPELLGKLEDTPFYRRSLVRTSLEGEGVEMVHETLDCRRLANPLVRLMLPFRMPRRVF
ncbi:carotenoid 1,2-hydratase [Rhodobacterales bacterium]|nr:carotenoid 1,2-hydratase [Rhodobacterales bacterium]